MVVIPPPWSLSKRGAVGHEVNASGYTHRATPPPPRFERRSGHKNSVADRRLFFPLCPFSPSDINNFSCASFIQRELNRSSFSACASRIRKPSCRHQKNLKKSRKASELPSHETSTATPLTSVSFTRAGRALPLVYCLNNRLSAPAHYCIAHRG